VGGIGKMAYPKFFIYNVSGGAAWVTAFLLGGYYLGNTDVVKRNFHLVVVGIVIVSVLPAVFKFLLTKRRPKPPVGEEIAVGAK
jgi:membrane-associated protein